MSLSNARWFQSFPMSLSSRFSVRKSVWSYTRELLPGVSLPCCNNATVAGAHTNTTAMNTLEKQSLKGFIRETRASRGIRIHGSITEMKVYEDLQLRHSKMGQTLYAQRLSARACATWGCGQTPSSRMFNRLVRSIAKNSSRPWMPGLLSPILPCIVFSVEH